MALSAPNNLDFQVLGLCKFLKFPEFRCSFEKPPKKEKSIKQKTILDICDASFEKNKIVTKNKLERKNTSILKHAKQEKVLHKRIEPSEKSRNIETNISKTKKIETNPRPHISPNKNKKEKIHLEEKKCMLKENTTNSQPLVPSHKITPNKPQKNPYNYKKFNILKKGKKYINQIKYIPSPEESPKDMHQEVEKRKFKRKKILKKRNPLQTMKTNYDIGYQNDFMQERCDTLLQSHDLNKNIQTSETEEFSSEYIFSVHVTEILLFNIK